MPITTPPSTPAVDRCVVHDDLAVHHARDLGQVAVGEGGEHLLEDQVAGDGGQGRRTVRLLGEADRDTDGEQQRHVVENGPATGCHVAGELRDEGRERVAAEHVRVTEPDQQGGCRQHRDGQHEAAADALHDSHHGRALLLGGRGAALAVVINFLHGTRRRREQGSLWGRRL